MNHMKYLGELDYDILFTTYDEFKSKRIKILNKYKNMEYKAKRMYKMFIYKSVILKIYQKDEIWEFLNGYGINILGIDK